MSIGNPVMSVKGTIKHKGFRLMPGRRTVFSELLLYSHYVGWKGPQLEAWKDFLLGFGCGFMRRSRWPITDPR